MSYDIRFKVKVALLWMQEETLSEYHRVLRRLRMTTVHGVWMPNCLNSQVDTIASAMEIASPIGCRFLNRRRRMSDDN